MHHILLTIGRIQVSILSESSGSRNFWSRSYISVLQATYSSSSLQQLSSTEISDPISCNKKIASFIRCGDLDSAIWIFQNMKTRTTVTWNSILAGLSSKPGKLKEVEDMFVKIPEPDTVSYNVMLSSYFKHSSLEVAKNFFFRIPYKDIASWNTMISGFIRNGKLEDAEELFHVMPKRNAVTWNSMISGYAEVGDMASALQLFEKAPVKDVVSWTSLLTGFMKCGKVELAERAFREMPSRNLVTWNSMVAGYVENGRGEDGLKLFKRMLESGVKPNPSSFSSVLLACSNFSISKLGKQIHQLALKFPLYSDTTVGTSLISMYCKCGILENGWKLFEEMLYKDIITWNAMISGYAQHGFSERALRLFDEMRSKGMRPDWITFIGVLSACNHAGLVDLGKYYFEEMQKVFEIPAKPDHYTCMIDLLSRAGELEEAMELIKNMPFEPHSAIYGTLLGACRLHKNLEIAEFAAMNLLILDPVHTAAAYVQIANVYASMKNWEGVSRIWRSMKKNGAIKTPGYSWIEVKNVMHEFRSGDRLHSELESIHEKLNELNVRMKLAGYVPVFESSLHDIAEEHKERLLLWHSEKLAIAFGLVKIQSIDDPIMVFKNLRVCEDCHLAIKFISAIESRVIILRDTFRFHHFRDGKCSCNDYW